MLGLSHFNIITSTSICAATEAGFHPSGAEEYFTVYPYPFSLTIHQGKTCVDFHFLLSFRYAEMEQGI